MIALPDTPEADDIRSKRHTQSIPVIAGLTAERLCRLKTQMRSRHGNDGSCFIFKQ
jgi:hypothetical protein